jgi:hypothetical protein
MHQARLERHGDVNIVKRGGLPVRPPIQRFIPKVEFVDKWHAGTRCLEWTATRSNHGYGRFQLAPGKPVGSHRWFYEYLFGPVGDGLEMDHLCRNRACCNPVHLEPVTRSVNVRRGLVGKITEEDRAVIRRLHAEGVRATAIGAELGVGGDCVADHLRAMGLTPHRDSRGSKATRLRAAAALEAYRFELTEVAS